MDPWTLALVGLAALEYWLGKTDKVKSNSTVAAVLSGIKLVVDTARKKK